MREDGETGVSRARLYAAKMPVCVCVCVCVCVYTTKPLIGAACRMRNHHWLRECPPIRADVQHIVFISLCDALQLQFKLIYLKETFTKLWPESLFKNIMKKINYKERKQKCCCYVKDVCVCCAAEMSTEVRCNTSLHRQEAIVWRLL